MDGYSLEYSKWTPSYDWQLYTFDISMLRWRKWNWKITHLSGQFTSILYFTLVYLEYNIIVLSWSSIWPLYVCVDQLPSAKCQHLDASEISPLTGNQLWQSQERFAGDPVHVACDNITFDVTCLKRTNYIQSENFPLETTLGLFTLWRLITSTYEA